ncbi:MCE family protein [Allosaccharopolyspora coralli]|uniref:MCE family protein n=1 Tax=Allosaccharopolyspora coralli TaxID=2665642 RepID=A0A5Q3QNV8_9PSEU|nr:MCE family protein [Allosaccharopolyspora coralli]QGK72447.1 MCE family protein [Allosaccharopolyspora coralli]
MSRSGTLKAVAATAVGLLLLSGCGFKGANDMPLPGGADIGDDPYQVRVQFRDVLDLVPAAGVRVNNVPVGRVDDVRLADGSWNAEVTLSVNGDVELPANAVARVRQSSLLGEKYVELAPPPEPQGGAGQLVDNDLIPIERTNRNPQVEEVLGALSLLLNGGGVGQLQNITQELNAALEGRGGDIKSLLGNLDELVGGLDAQRGDITRALDSVNRLSATLNAQRDDIDTALRDLGPGLQVLNEQRGQLVTMLQSLDRLSGVATNVVNQSQDDLVHNLEQLQPTLQQLEAAGDNFPKAFEILLTYPFPDAAVEGIKGDYTNLYVNIDMNLSTIIGNIVEGSPPPPPEGSTPFALPPSPAPELPEVPGPGLLPGLEGSERQQSPEPPPPPQNGGEESGGPLGGLLSGGS